MPRTKLLVPDVAEAGPALWSNAIRAGDMLFISGQVARPFEGGTEMVGKDEYEQSKQIFSRIDRIIKAAGGTMDNLVKMTIYVVDKRKTRAKHNILHACSPPYQGGRRNDGEFGQDDDLRRRHQEQHRGLASWPD